MLNSMDIYLFNCFSTILANGSGLTARTAKKSRRRAAHKSKKLKNKIEIENYILFRTLIEFKHSLWHPIYLHKFFEPFGFPQAPWGSRSQTGHDGCDSRKIYIRFGWKLWEIYHTGCWKRPTSCYGLQGMPILTY